MSSTTRNTIIGGLIAGAVLSARSLVRSRRLYDLKNKVVLITGGSRGLGLVMAREFAAQGARLVICARDAEELERARAELSGSDRGESPSIYYLLRNFLPTCAC